MADSGAVQAGGGTSIYLDTLSGNEMMMMMRCPKYISMSALYGDKYLVSFSNADNSSASVLQVVSSKRASPQKASVAGSFYTPFSIYKHITLNETSGLFVIVTQDFSSVDNMAVVIAGRVRPDIAEISYGPPVIYNPANYSVTPDVSKLDASSFAIVYYNGTNILTRTGTSRENAHFLFRLLNFFILYPQDMLILKR